MSRRDSNLLTPFQTSELENERSHHAAELEQVRRRYEEAVAEAEERHQRSIEQFQDRDQAWQNEKQVTIGITSVHLINALRVN